MFKKLTLESEKRIEFIDITSKISVFVQESGVKEGLIVLHVPHTTAGVTINENADPDVKKDIIKQLNNLAPLKNDYQHLEGNSDAHIKTSLVGNDQTIILKDNRLMLGRWQGIYFCEFDGPRTRNVYLKIINGEK